MANGASRMALGPLAKNNLRSGNYFFVLDTTPAIRGSQPEKKKDTGKKPMSFWRFLLHLTERGGIIRLQDNIRAGLGGLPSPHDPMQEPNLLHRS